jgi:hypothetical protein
MRTPGKVGRGAQDVSGTGEIAVLVLSFDCFHSYSLMDKATTPDSKRSAHKIDMKTSLQIPEGKVQYRILPLPNVEGLAANGAAMFGLFT